MTSFKNIGRSLPILDGREKVTGRLRFAPDVQLPGMLHARLVTSPHAHARIEQIETAAARAVPGVVAILTSKEMPDIPPKTRSRLLLARDRVIFSGQPVALVLAESVAAAQDGADQVWVDYQPLPAAMTLDDALSGEAPLVWPGGAPGDSGEAADRKSVV